MGNDSVGCVVVNGHGLHGEQGDAQNATPQKGSAETSTLQTTISCGLGKTRKDSEPRVASKAKQHGWYFRYPKEPEESMARCEEMLARR